MSFIFDKNIDKFPVVKVFGVGGAGVKVLNRLKGEQRVNLDLIAMDTDLDSLNASTVDLTIPVSYNTAKKEILDGVWNLNSDEDKQFVRQIIEALRGTDMIFLISGMGGKTGSTVSSIIARVAKELKIMTVAILSRPFDFESRTRSITTTFGYESLRLYADGILMLSNNNVFEVAGGQMSTAEMFANGNIAFCQQIYAFLNVIAGRGINNFNYEDVRSILECTNNLKNIYLGVGEACDEIEATMRALHAQILEVTIEGARHIFLNIETGKDLNRLKLQEMIELALQMSKREVEVILGLSVKEVMKDMIRVTVIA